MEETLSTSTDEELAVLSLKDPNPYNVLVHRHGAGLAAFIARRFASDRCSAEDVSQEALLKAYLSLASFDSSKKFKTWLYAIAINGARSLMRRQPTEDLDTYANVLCSSGSPEQYVEASIERDLLDATLACLDFRHRVVLEMHYRHELTYAEISAALGLKLGTVKARIFRAKQLLCVNFKPPRQGYDASL